MHLVLTLWELLSLGKMDSRRRNGVSKTILLCGLKIIDIESMLARGETQNREKAWG